MKNNIMKCVELPPITYWIRQQKICARLSSSSQRLSRNRDNKAISHRNRFC
ncbi:MAG: hypothetical protein R3Y08_01545 [Rikenellaceae bacterium]